MPRKRKFKLSSIITPAPKYKSTPKATTPVLKKFNPKEAFKEITFKEFVEANLIPSEETLDEMVSVGGEVSYSCKVNSAKNKITVKMSASVSQDGVEMSISGTFVMTKK